MSIIVDDENNEVSPSLAKVQSRPSLLIDQSAQNKAMDDVSQIANAANENFGQTPDAAAKMLDLELKTGLPTKYIQENLQEAEKYAHMQNFSPEHLKETSPKFAAWIAQNPNHYTFVKEDLDKYKRLEANYFGEVKDDYGPKDIWNTMDYGAVAGLNYLSHSFAAGKGTASLLAEKSELIGKRIRKEDTAADRKREADVDQYMKLMQEEADVDTKTGTALRDVGYSVGQLGTSMGAGAVGAAEGAALGIAMAPMTAGASLALVPVLALTGRTVMMGMTNYEMETNFAYDDLTKYEDKDGKKFDEQSALWVARGIGVVNAALETVADTFILESIPGFASRLGIVKKFTRKTVQELAAKALAKPTVMKSLAETAKVMIETGSVESLTEFGQKISSSMGMRLGQSIEGLKGDNSSWMQDVGEGVNEAWHAGLGTALTLGLAHTGPNLHQRLRVIKEGQQNADFYKAIHDGVNSDSFKALPEKGQEAVKAALAQGAGEFTYFQKDDWDKNFTDKGLDPRETALLVAQDGGKAYDAAAANGGFIKLSTDRVGRKLLQVPEHVDFVINDSTVSPDRATVRQAAQEFDDLMKQVKEGKTVLETSRDHTKDEVYIKIRDALLAARVPGGKEAAEYHATLYNAKANRFAGMMGIKPMDLYERYGTGITRSALQSIERKNIDESDPDLDRLRTGDIPTAQAAYGPGVLDLLRSLGGVNHNGQGGDIKAKEPDKGAAPFTKRISNPEGVEIDRASEQAHEAGYIKDQDVRELLAAVDKELGGGHVSSARNHDDNLIERRERLLQMSDQLDRLGIDLQTMDNEAIKKALHDNIRLQRAFDPTDIFFQSDLNTDPLGFFSQLEAEVEKMDFKSMPSKDLANRLKNIQGVKKEELEHTGILDWLALTDAKVTKEQVLEYLKGKGIKLEQIVLGEAASGRSSDELTDWTEMRRDTHYDHSDDIQAEVENTLYDDDGVAEEMAALRPRYIADFTDEDGNVDEEGLDDKLMDVIRDNAYRVAEENAQSDDYYYAQFYVTERNTGWSLHGNDELGWYNSDTSEHFETSLEEAQIRLTQMMIEEGELEGSVADLVKDTDIKWDSPQGDMPAYETVKEKARELLKTDLERFIQAENAEYPDQYSDLSPEDKRERLESDAAWRAEAEVRERYNDPFNPDNIITTKIRNGIIEGRIVGNNVRGYRLRIASRNRLNSDKQWGLDSNDLDSAKLRAIQILLHNGYISSSAKTNEVTGPDINRPTGKDKWKRFTVEKSGKNYREFLLTIPAIGPRQFHYPTHFDEKNIIVHVRTTERIDSKGNRVLFIEEVQSDWHQQGRERGYDNPTDNAHRKALLDGLYKRLGEIAEIDLEDEHQDKKTLADLIEERKHLREDLKAIESAQPVPDAPLANTEAWAGLAIKRMISLAATENFDAIGLTPGSVHVDRWGTESVGWHKQGGEQFSIEDNEAHQMFLIKNADGKALKYFHYAHVDDGHGAFTSKNEARAESEAYAKERAEHHWLVGSVSQRGGHADGIDLEAAARERGLLLERHGERVKTKAQLKSVLRDTLSSDRGFRSINSLTETIWKQMQETPSGAKHPRKDGLEFFYDNVLPKKVFPPLLKKLDKEAKVTVGAVITNNSYTAESLVDDISERSEENLIGDGDALKSWMIHMTPTMKENALKGMALFQKHDAKEPNAQINVGGKLGVDRKMSIEFFKKANFSSFIHEESHYWLEVMADAIARGEANDELKGMWADTLKWLGVKDYTEITRDHHEKFARGFEAYHFEGKAPTPELQGIFNTFKVWLGYVYESLQALGVELSPEIRSVFDRMYASEEAINRAKAQQSLRAIINDPANANMTPEQAEKYRQLVQETHNESLNRLTVQTMKQIQKERSLIWKRERAQVKSKMTKEVDGQADQILLKMLREGHAPGHAEGDLKLNKQALIEEYGEEFVKRLPKGIYSENGYNHHILANMMQFENAFEMIQMLGNVENRNELIEKKTSEEMKSRYGDQDMYTNGKLEEEAMWLIHSEKQAELMQMEIDWLLQNKTKEAKGMIKSVVRRVTPLATTRETAEAIIQGMPINEIKPHIYLLAEKRHSNAAFDLMMSGDFEGSLDAKKKALLNLELYRAAKLAKDYIAKSEKKLNKFFLDDKKIAKSRDTNTVSAARAILAAFGFGKDPKTPEDHLAKIKEYDPAAYKLIAERVSNAIQQAEYYGGMSLEKFKALNDLVNALWNQARSDMMIEVEGVKVAIGLVNAEIIAAIEKLPYDPAVLSRKQKQQEHEKIDGFFLTIGSRLTRMESKIDSMDAVAKHNNVFRKFIYNPVREATETYRLKKGEITVQFNELLLSHKEALTDKKRIEAKGLDYTFDKAELLGAMLHMGTLSNFKKLLLGRGWGSKRADGSLDSTQWDKFIHECEDNGILTAADYQFLEKYWQIVGSFKADAQKAHMDMFGYYFDEIEGRTISTKFGTIQGGYVPASPDRTESKDPAIRNEAATIEDNVHDQLPQKNDGFSKNRVENYSTPLIMDIGLMRGHVDQVLKFTYVTPRVRDALKIVHNREVRNMFDAYDPTFVSHVVIPFLQRASTQSTTVRSKDKGTEAVLNFMRNNRSMSLMFANMPNTIQQFANYLPLALRANPSFILNAIVKGTTDNKGVTKMISEKSVFMRNKLDRSYENAEASIESILNQHNKAEKGAQWFAKNTYLAQMMLQNVMDTHVWLAAYDQAISDKKTENEAVAYADSTVRNTQGTYAAEDTSDVETQGAFMKSILMFFGFFNNMGNLYRSEWIKAGAEGGIKGAGKKAFIAGNFVLFAIAGKVLIQAVSGSLGDDKDDDESWLLYCIKYMFGSSLELAAPMAGGPGQLVFGAYKHIVGDNKGLNSGRLSVSPVLSMAEQVIEHTFGSKKLKDRGRVRNAADLMSLVPAMGFIPPFGLAKQAGYLGLMAKNLNRLRNLNGYVAPIGGLARPAGYLADKMESGKETTLLEDAQGLISGRPKKKK